MRGALVSFLLVAGLSFGAGCVLITGGTDGYTQAGGAAAAGASCTSAANCGDGGNVCCLIVTAQTMSTAGTCASTCAITVPTAYPQLCKTSAECGDAGPCNLLTCTVDAGGTGYPVTLQACGMIPGCTGP
jgi:hypothetical protein